ncbi:MAG: transglycosylase SLT domain-containing protein [Candidatus Aminicenantes bacterium]|nr:transglycosylase SLT domain-containing protein [Candidatus Aminicenantes bacterium]
MISPPKKHGILLFFIGLSGIFLVCAIVLSAKQSENKKTILSLQKTVDSLAHKLGSHRKAIEKTDFYRFQDKIYRLQMPEFAKITNSVFSLSRKHGLNPYLTMAIIYVESHFDRHAVSKVGACGLMQVNYPVWKDELNIDRRKLFQVDYNIELGLTILKGYLRETRGDVIKALILYNNGYKYTNTNYHEKVIATNFYKQANIS